MPISNTQTSVVCSLDVRKRTYVDKDVIRLIYKNNPGYKIKKILKLNSFKLSFINLRNYRYKKILAFGDLIHKIHPLAGQGFNMSLRDIRALSEIIQNKINLGIELNTSVLEEFEKKTKSRNFLFSNGIDFIYEIFNVDKKINNKILSKTLKIIGGNKMFTNYLIKLADKGLNL